MRVFIGEDQGLLRDTLAQALNARGVEVAGTAGSLPDILDRVADVRPDVCLLDIRMPPTGTDEGLRAAEWIRAHHPGIGILVLSQHAETAYAVRLLEVEDEARGLGYLLKERVADLTVLIDAIERVARGEVVVDPVLVSRLLARRRASDALSRLTERERDVLALIAEGRSNAYVARHLHCSGKTVEKYAASVYSKLGLAVEDPITRAEMNTRVLAVLAYLRHST
ncbi:response regulator transcription factor [Cellulomonas cellasea]|uniref:LuxR family transcriptional regulator n=2 Tax=Cellulomonas cellasea TaxID=43670 RepID=A0A0A0B968_9CELL|nr:response regulator transcription factor [Cellulomonas cellasea]KGM03400.1 hypothetical protein Q760_03980 [Cellulomonas cellasea DSM 20118]GEA90235.1 DNA-binding response regulator [Cellulomonas cellasea]